MPLDIRKLVVHLEETRAEGGRGDAGGPLRKVAALAVIPNPYAGRPWSGDLDDLVGPSGALARELAEAALAVLGAPVESYGKAALAGLAGEQEHANACITRVFGDALRAAVGGGKAWLPLGHQACPRPGRRSTSRCATRTPSGSAPTTTPSRWPCPTPRCPTRSWSRLARDQPGPAQRPAGRPGRRTRSGRGRAPVTWDGTFDPGAFGPPGGTLELRNLRGLVSGRLGEAPVAAGTLRVEAGRVVSVGADPAEADVVVDAAGAVAVPGLIDTHCHVVFGDYTPRQHAVGFLESYLHGGVTQVMSASEVHLPGRPRDRAGVKALAVAAQRACIEFRPGGVKVRGGSLICEPVLRERRLRRAGRRGRALQKVGFGAFDDPPTAVPLVGWARAAGFVVMSHSGGASIPGSSADHRRPPAGHGPDHRRPRQRRHHQPPRPRPGAAGRRLRDGPPDRPGGQPPLGPAPARAGQGAGAAGPGDPGHRHPQRHRGHAPGPAQDRGRAELAGRPRPSRRARPGHRQRRPGARGRRGHPRAGPPGRPGPAPGAARRHPGRPPGRPVHRRPARHRRGGGRRPVRALRSRNTPAPAREATATGRSPARWPR